MISDYIPVFMQLIAALGFCSAMLVTSVVLGKKGSKNPIKDSAYECGMLPIGSGSPRLSIKFYLIAMLFVLFDIEAVFLYPWATSFQDLLSMGNSSAFWGAVSFVIILLFAYIYAFGKGALRWR